MSARCDLCGKGPGFGNNVSRLGVNATHRRVKGRSGRMFRANIQRARVAVGGVTRQVNACTGCIKKSVTRT